MISLFFSCAPAYKSHIESYRFDNPQNIPDYSRLEYWAAHPWKWDPSDSVPGPIRAISSIDSSVDVFFLHPTTFGSKTGSTDGWNADINDPGVNAKTDYTTILYQASAFNECRVFAPRYRQANLMAYYTSDTERARQSFDTAYADIKTAFQYYLDHYNQGRPIIIASHSQGSTHAKRLLKEFFEEGALKRQLVTAYIIGMAIPKNYFADLKPCSDSLETGCFVGWRTFREGYTPAFVQKENGDSYIVNPLTWTINEGYAPKNLNIGAVLTGFNSIFPELTDAQIHGDILWTNKPHFPGSFFFRTKNYHIGDINLYYLNIRENLRCRIKAFKKSRS
jgi:hypothetical protein